MRLKIEYLDKKALKPYAKNAKIHTKSQIEQIKRSIQEFGFNDPIAIWKDNVIIEGHGRLLAVMEMKEITTVPVIRLDSLTDEQRRAYTLVHNKLTMNTDFDMELLDLELSDLSDFDAEFYDFDIPIDDDWDDKDSDERAPSVRHNVFENQERMQFPITNYYGIPELKPTQTTGNNFLRFCDWNQVDDLSEYIAHFYYHDFQFISAWRDPDKYLDRLCQFKAVVCPDFSSYTDFPRVLQILGAYRRNWCGAYWQSLGLDVIPDVQWTNEESYEWCFDGIPKESTVAISSLGIYNNPRFNGEQDTLFKKGFDKMVEVLNPSTILWYGNIIDGCEGNIVHIPSYHSERRRRGVIK